MAESVVVSDLVKAYGSLRAVDQIDFTVRTGEVFSFLGPNGAGKTTTVEILEGLRKRTSGNVRVIGYDPWTEGASLQSKMGVIPQDFRFFPKLTPREAIQLYAGLFRTKVDVRELLTRVELEDKESDHYDTLSGGQRQKLGLALALVNNPEICFLDEPTTGLDPRARRSIWEVIRGLRKEGRTVFLTSHYLEEAQLLSDRIAIINRGKIVAAGTPDELIAQYGKKERLRLRADPALGGRIRDSLGLPVEQDGAVIEVELRSKGDALRVLQLAESSGLTWESFSTVQDTLEDVFIRLVGRVEDGRLAQEPRPESPP